MNDPNWNFFLLRHVCLWSIQKCQNLLFFVVDAFAFRFDYSEGTNLIFPLKIRRCVLMDELKNQETKFTVFLSVSERNQLYSFSFYFKLSFQKWSLWWMNRNNREQKCVLFLPIFVFLCFQNGSLKWTMKNGNSGLSIAFWAEKIQD